MIMRRFLLPSLATLIVTIAVSWFWLLHTESGMRWLWEQAQEAVPGALNAQSVTGSLRAGVSLHSVDLRMDGVTVSMDKVEAAIDFDVLPLSLEIKTLRVTALQISLFPGNASEDPPTDPRQVLESLALPIRLVLTDAQINDVTIAGLIEDRVIHLREVELRAELKDQLQIEYLRVAMAGGSAEIMASMDLRQPFSLDISGQMELLPLMTGYNKAIDVKLSAAGSLDSMTVNIETTGLDARLRGSIDHVLTMPAWDVTLDVSAYARSLNEARILNVQNIAVTSVGHVDEYSLQASASLDLTGFAPVVMRLAGTGSLQSINLSSVVVDSEEIALSATAKVRWTQAPSVVADIRLNRLQPHAFLKEWPVSELAEGRVSLRLENNRLLLKDMKFGIKGRDAMLTFAASVDLETAVVQAELKWQDVQWPVADPSPEFASEQGSALLSGTLDNWRVDAHAAIRAAGIPSGKFVITGGGNRERMALRIEEGDVLGGSVRGEFAYSWVGEQPLAAAFDLAYVSTGALFPEWPGTLSGSVEVDGHLQPFRLHVTLKDINGSLRGESLTARGDIDFGDGELLADALTIEHGASHVHLGGSLFSPDGLAFDLQLSNLGNYLHDYYGSFKASGHVSLGGSDPALAIDLSSDVIGYRDYRMRGIRISPQENGGHLLTAEDIFTPSGQITDVAIRASLSPREQAVALSAAVAGIWIDAELVGAFDDWQQAGQSPWKGQLQSLRFKTADEQSIELLEPTGLILSTSEARVEPFCIGTDSTSYFCAEAGWSTNGAAYARFDLDDVPIALLNTVVQSHYDLDQLISGSFAWRQQANQQTYGEADITISPGVFRDTTDSRVTVRTGPGKFAFDIQDGRLLTGRIDLPMPGTGSVSGNFSVLDVSQGTESQVAGNLDIVINNIAMLAAFTPLVDNASGEFDAHILLQGIAVDPILSGEFGLANGKLAYLPLGLDIDELQLSGTFHDDQRIEIDGHFLAGDGRATIKMRADYQRSSDAGLEFELRGDNLTVISVPDVQAVANIDLRVRFIDESLVLGGTIFFPEARIAPQNLTMSRVSESSDVVIIAGSLAHEEDVAEPDQNLQILGELELGLGDNILIDLGIAKAKVSGTAVFTWSGDPIPLANGRYDLQGNIRAFGQVLEISEGAIRFPNIPANNPFIHLRAEREIYGNSQIKRAGVLIDGTARRQTIEAYTNPPSNADRALTLLVTGSDFDLEQGIGAIDFGTYIAPKLFVSYAIGLFESENVISARYDLVKGFGVRATSGQKSSGLDFIYRIER